MMKCYLMVDDDVGECCEGVVFVWEICVVCGFDFILIYGC